jgi:hypothetical protein
MKRCHVCTESKELDSFSKDKNRKDGHYPTCKSCIKLAHASHYRQNRDKILARNIAWNAANPESLYRARKKWEAVPGQNAAKNARRRASKNEAQPRWLSEDQLKWIAWHYTHAAKMEEVTGIKHHVDHIHPLNGKKAAGLHVPWNLQVMPSSENIRKSNRWHEDSQPAI